MKRRRFSLSLLSLLSALPVTARRIFGFPAEETAAHVESLPGAAVQTQPPAAGTVALFPVGFKGDSFGLTAFAEGGEMLTQVLSVELTGGVNMKIEMPLVERGAFPPAEQTFRLVQGTADFGTGVGQVPYSVIAVDSNRAWTAKGVQVAARGELLTVKASNSETGATPIIVSEQFGATPLDVTMSQNLRRLLQQRGLDVDKLIDGAKAPNIRQQMLFMTGGAVTFRIPDPPLAPAFADALGTVQVIIWSPVPITVLEREG